MPVDEQILVAGTSSVPLSYTVPNAIEAALLCVNATVDGTAAASSFLATVEIVSDGGVVVARCPCFNTLAAGASAEISWFRLRQTTITAPAATPYEETILTTPDIRGYWKLDETSGTTAFDSGTAGADLTYQNFPTLGQPPLADGTSVTFDAAFTQFVGGYSLPPINGIQGNNQMTVEFWVETSAAVRSALVWSDSSGPNGRWFTVEMGNTGDLSYAIFNSAAAGFNVAIAAAMNDGVKHYVVGTYDGTTMRLYYDTVLSASLTLPVGQQTLQFTNHGLAFATAYDPINHTELFTGTLDEVAIYARALTQAEIDAHFAAA